MAKGPDIRIGTVSTIDYEHGMVSVKYEELSGAVTAEMPVLSFNDEYKMPNIDDTVLVLYLSNGSSIGIVLGKIWNEGNPPVSAGKGLYRKQIADDAFMEYKDGTLKIKAPKVLIETDEGNIEY